MNILTGVSVVTYPINPIFLPLISTTLDFLMCDSFLSSGNSESSMLQQIMGKEIFFRKGTNPSIPSSNSWFPGLYKNYFKFVIYIFKTKKDLKEHVYHGIKIEKICKLCHYIPFETCIPDCPLIKVSSVDKNNIFIIISQIIYCFLKTCHSSKAFVCLWKQKENKYSKASYSTASNSTDLDIAWFLIGSKITHTARFL